MLRVLGILGPDTILWRFGIAFAAGLVLLAVTGCSGLNPFGSDNSPLPLPPPLEADAEGVVADKTGRKADAEASAESEEAGAAGEESGSEPEADAEYPELADVPDGAQATKAQEKAPEAQAEREQLAGELLADRDQAKYTDEELRGGRVPAVAPPRSQPPVPPRAEAAPAQQPPAPQKPETQAAPAPVTAPIQSPGLTPAPPPAAATPPQPAGAAAPLAPPTPRATAPAPVRQPAPSYSSSTFQPSTAAALPRDLAASLPPGVAQRYQETLRLRPPGVPVALPVAPVIAGPGGAAFASVPFASGSSQLSSADRRTIAQVAAAASSGGRIVRVVGHASSSASTQSESQRMLANWEISQARATAVADALVREGVAADKIIIEAVGDSESSNAYGYGDAEAAARRVDLFLE